LIDNQNPPERPKGTSAAFSSGGACFWFPLVTTTSRCGNDTCWGKSPESVQPRNHRQFSFRVISGDK
jgi:hypothetical protein